jgi:hypothetical protein
VTIKLDHDQLNTHATNMKTAADAVGQAAEAADTVQLGNGAFGVMCSFLPPVLQTFTPTQSSGIWSSKDALTNTHMALSWAATDMQDTDDFIAGALNKLAP